MLWCIICTNCASQRAEIISGERSGASKLLRMLPGVTCDRHEPPLVPCEGQHRSLTLVLCLCKCWMHSVSVILGAF